LKRVFVAANSEERLLTLCVPKGTRRLYHVKFDVEWHSRKTSAGVFAAMAAALSKEHFSILRAYNYTMKRTRSSEIATVRFILNGPPTTPEERRAIVDRWRTLTHKGGNVLAEPPHITPAEEFKELNDPLVLVPDEVYQPKCFLARLSSKQSDDITKKARGVIGDLGFGIEEGNVNLLAANNRNESVADQIVNAIRRCCCMVVLMEKGEFFKNKGKAGMKPTVSPWLVAEDAMAVALGLHVVRLKHKNVEHQTFTWGMQVIEFDDGSVDEACKNLRTALKEWLKTEKFVRAHTAAIRRSLKEW